MVLRTFIRRSSAATESAPNESQSKSFFTKLKTFAGKIPIRSLLSIMVITTIYSSVSQGNDGASMLDMLPFSFNPKPSIKVTFLHDKFTKYARNMQVAEGGIHMKNISRIEDYLTAIVSIIILY